MEKEMTGYPSIDRPWLKYYTEDAIKMPLPECTVYEYMASSNQKFPDRIAIDYFSRKISYGELLKNIDQAANAFYALGIRGGDVVAGVAPGFPEIIYSFYALNKIGAVSDWFDPRTSPDIILKEMKETKAKVLIIMDAFINLFHGYSLPVDTIIVVSAKDSLPFPAKIVMSLKKTSAIQSAHYSWKNFLLLGQGTKAEIVKENVAHRPALMEHTGGTTGNPKAVILTNQNINSVAHQYRNGFGDTYSKDDIFLSTSFPFVAYSIIGGLTDPLAMGMQCVLCFKTDANAVGKLLIKKKCNHMSNTPSTWEHLKNSTLLKNKDIPFLRCPIVGADVLSAASEKSINHFFAEHGCTSNIMKGYGMTEVSSAVSVCPSNEINKIGSVGIPFLKTIISIFDAETGEELPYGQQGEICISGPSVMLGYFNNVDETTKVLREHKDGRIWMHSGDLGYMDEDGFLFIVGRLKRMLIDHVGFKIFAPQVEQVISSCENVEKCCVVGAPDTENGSGQIAVAFVIVKESEHDDEDKIREVCEKSLPEYAVPKRICFVSELPYTGAGKVDYRTLEEKAKG